MAIVSDALRQAFMPKHEYESLREEEKAWHRMQKPLILLALALVSLAISVSTAITFRIVFPADNLRRPFCRDFRIHPLPVNFTGDGDSDLLTNAFVLTDQETVDYYWMVMFLPSSMLFAVSAVYLIAGIIVAYTAPTRNGCLKVVENNYCASRRGGVRCLSILNLVFSIIFGLLALFLGSTLLTLGSSCSLPLFWCYEIASWGFVILHGGAAFFLRRKAEVVLDERETGGRNFGLEMLEATPTEVTPEVERRVTDGFKSWMGPSILSSDDEDELDEYLEVPDIVHSSSAHQRV
ncbi:hypothetical protein SASPL_153177 [Salvia splendens]|uniref:Transmembrane protein n=1 Tax=Salvia splendens TaxID=180675 RepID=A0A8X8W4Q8_SALSN|nr:uncharacterized protein LOC121784563 [Salvia splendens]KAG6387981.1 hypothetical protein SASPL_153177 [Salvia splendens]